MTNQFDGPGGFTIWRWHYKFFLRFLPPWDSGVRVRWAGFCGDARIIDAVGFCAHGRDWEGFYLLFLFGGGRGSGTPKVASNFCCLVFFQFVDINSSLRYFWLTHFTVNPDEDSKRKVGWKAGVLFLSALLFFFLFTWPP